MWSVSVGAVSSVSNTLVSRAVGVINDAMAYWARYLSFNGSNLEIEVDFIPLDDEILAQAGTDFVFQSVVSGNDIYQAGTIIELQTGFDPNGAAPDIFIEINSSDLVSGNFYLGGPQKRSVPSDKFDLFTIALHEIGHGLGIISLRDTSIGLAEYDRFVKTTAGGGYVFTGPNARTTFGGIDVPLEDEPTHIGGTPNQYEDLMNSTLFSGRRMFVTDLHISILQDIGMPVLEPTTGDDTLYGFDKTVGNFSGEETAFLLAGNDLYFGLDGSDTVYGWAGNDTIHGDDGSDDLYGGAGNDNISGGEGDDAISGGEGFDTLDGGAGADTLFGSRFSDRLLGGAGSDSLNAGANDDIARGDGGSDTVNGGSGSDLLEGGNGDDLLIGAKGFDTLTGGDGRDTLIGGDAADTLFGGRFFDLLKGGDGDDSLNAGNNRDVAKGEVGDDTVNGGAGSDLLSGDDGNDLLIGAKGFDTLDGGDGDDTLVGGNASDTLTGGIGNDLFNFNLGNDDDVITDFVAGAASEDMIRLSGFGAAFDTFGEVLAVATDDGLGNTVIDFGGGDRITLEDVATASLDADDFVFA